jgi:cytochrome c biogenesis protein CcmG/thiol:disulfide interchange protein DsbE
MSARLKLGAQILAVGLVALLLALLIWKVARGSGNKAAPGKPAPNFTLNRIDRPGRLQLAALRGKVVVLNFWASWCRPACYEEAPALERTWREYKDKGVVVVGIDIQDRDEAARTFLAEFGHSFPNAPDPAGRIAVDYGVYGVPETFFIDRNGRVRFKQVGALTDELARQRLDTLLKEPS